MATQKLFVEVSAVRNRRDPHMCVAEFTSQVECSPRTVRRKTAPNHERPTTEREKHHPNDVRHPMLFADPHIKFVFAKVGNVGEKFPTELCIALPVMIQPMCAHRPPSRGECGSPSLSVFW